VTAQGDIAVLGGSIVNNVMNNVSYFAANRPGPPSWVIRCLETNELFMSQAQAAFEMELLPCEISNHLNGLRDDVRGFHFERICMAA
jgi:hypothetical protein